MSVKSITSYNEALSYFYSYAQYDPVDASNWSLARTIELLERIGSPHKVCPSLLIAGTKGKGSTAAITESILRQAGYKTGLYTSPHLHSFRERICLEGKPISEELIIELANRLQPYFEDTPRLTAFELMTAVAFAAFAEKQIDVAVLEVGLGGRLDSTNVVEPAVAVITTISYDHTRILGNTLSLIAREKAGIIKPDALVISSPQPDEAMRVIEAVCREKQAKLVVVGRDVEWTLDSDTLDGQRFTVNGQQYSLPLLGSHQAANAVTAITAINGLTKRTGLTIPAGAVEAGTAGVNWFGRLEILNRNPYLIVDGAMNGDSAEKLKQALSRYFPNKKITFIFGSSYDHPISDMLKALLPISRQMFAAAAHHPRSEKPERLSALAASLGYQITAVADLSATLTKILENSQPDDIIAVTGSLFLVADAREFWLRRNNLPLPPIDTQVTS